MKAKDQSLPITTRISDDIAQQIRTHALHPGMKLPSERELSEERSISRMTARRVYERLEDQGLVASSNRKGWFVAEPRLQFAPTKSVSFLNSVGVRGRDARARVLHVGEIDPPDTVRAELKLKKHENTYFVRRLLLLGDRAAAIEAMYLAPSRFPDFLSRPLTGSILTLWEETYGVTVGHSNTTLRGAYLSKEEAQLLDVPKGSPTIILGQAIMDSSGKAFAYDRQHWKFDLAEFLISARYEK